MQKLHYSYVELKNICIFVENRVVFKMFFYNLENFILNNAVVI